MSIIRIAMLDYRPGRGDFLALPDRAEVTTEQMAGAALYGDLPCLLLAVREDRRVHAADWLRRMGMRCWVWVSGVTPVRTRDSVFTDPLRLLALSTWDSNQHSVVFGGLRSYNEYEFPPVPVSPTTNPINTGDNIMPNNNMVDHSQLVASTASWDRPRDSRGRFTITPQRSIRLVDEGPRSILDADPARLYGSPEVQTEPAMDTSPHVNSYGSTYMVEACTYEQACESFDDPHRCAHCHNWFDFDSTWQLANGQHYTDQSASATTWSGRQPQVYLTRCCLRCIDRSSERYFNCMSCEEREGEPFYYPRRDRASLTAMCVACWEDSNPQEYDDDDEYVVEDGRIIHDYSYRPAPEFRHNDGSISFDAADHVTYMGFELEMECTNGADPTTLGRTILKDLNDAAYIKTDGSLSYGIELVTHPHTLAAYKDGFDWGWAEKVANMGGRSWSASSCGLHIHVGVSTFESRSHFARWWMLFHRNTDQWVKLAGRDSARWATFGDWDDSAANQGAIRRAIGYMPFNLENSPSAPPPPDYYRMRPQQIDEAEFRRNQFFKYHPNQLAQKGRRGGTRYVALNTNNEHTVELRFWRPSLRHTTVLAALEATAASVEYTRGLRVLNKKEDLATKLAVVKWDAFRSWVKDHANEYPYLDSRIVARFNEAGDGEPEAGNVDELVGAL